jgi:predicted lipoprotein with Yx(FWY)xxD motif
MKSIILAIAALSMGVSTSIAAEPATVSDVGGAKAYTDAKGMTLYTFDKDSSGTTNCYDQCAVNWPPFEAAADAQADGDWSLVDRKDGSKMWAYEGKPLYTFVGDKKPGDMAGDGKMGVWHIARPD